MHRNRYKKCTYKSVGYILIVVFPLFFRVIGVLGGEGVGKTHILSLLASHPAENKSPFSTNERNLSPSSIAHSTAGVNMYITNERTILLGKLHYIFILPA